MTRHHLMQPARSSQSSQRSILSSFLLATVTCRAAIGEAKGEGEVEGQGGCVCVCGREAEAKAAGCGMNVQGT